MKKTNIDVYMFYKKGIFFFFLNCKFHRKILVPESFLNKVAGLRPEHLFCRRLPNDYFFTYMNWRSRAPIQWKIDKLKNLVKRSSIFICSDQHLLQKHVDYLKKVLLQNVVKINDYPSKTVEKITRS